MSPKYNRANRSCSAALDGQPTVSGKGGVIDTVSIRYCDHNAYYNGIGSKKRHIIRITTVFKNTLLLAQYLLNKEAVRGSGLGASILNMSTNKRYLLPRSVGPEASQCVLKYIPRYFVYMVDVLSRSATLIYRYTHID